MTRASEARKRLERVIHARIPAALEVELKKAADRLRVPVSNLVRQLLEDSLKLAENAAQDVSTRLARALRPHGDGLKGVVAWQSVVMHVASICASCGKELRPGARAQLGLGETPARRVFVCATCAPRTGRRSKVSGRGDESE